MAARVLREEGGAKACTDVTGFGLLGHLVEMIKASNENEGEGGEAASGRIRCVLELDTLPLLEGARECVAQGIVSSLQPHNLRLRRAIDLSLSSEGVGAHGAYPLLFDPQTAGGLLAGVPPEKAETVLKRLREEGLEGARVIGRVVEAEEGGEVCGVGRPVVVLTCQGGDGTQDRPL
jgi:selenide,water dikinase